jgi:ABC-2 type transport system ATP-binding protein
MSNILEAKNIVKKYANHTALNGVDISIETGSIFGLLGPNGAGKTSFIRIINQITAPDSGNILFKGSPLNEKHISQIGYLPEERGLYKKMKVGEQALYLAQLKGLSKAEAKRKLREWFEKFEITAWWDKKVEELSKGMAQKVQFVVTVLHEPKLLILDEPFSGFDPINTNLIKAEIQDLRKKGTTVIFSTHNMASVEEICDNIALIHQSKKILDGAVSSIKEQFKKNIYEIEFKGNMISFTNALWTGAELIEHTENKGFTKAQIKLAPNTNTNNILQGLIPHVEIHGLREILPSMNDIFIQQVSEMNLTNQE